MLLPAHSFIRDDAERHSPVLPHCVWVLAAPVRGHNNSQSPLSSSPCSQCCTEARSGPLEGAAEHTHSHPSAKVDGFNLWIENYDKLIKYTYSKLLIKQLVLTFFFGLCPLTMPSWGPLPHFSIWCVELLAVLPNLALSTSQKCKKNKKQKNQGKVKKERTNTNIFKKSDLSLFLLSPPINHQSPTGPNPYAENHWTKLPKCL